MIRRLHLEIHFVGTETLLESSKNNMIVNVNSLIYHHINNNYSHKSNTLSSYCMFCLHYRVVLPEKSFVYGRTHTKLVRFTIICFFSTKLIL